MKISRLVILWGLVIFNSLLGQVCCSLVGSVDSNGGTSASRWNTHWPSDFENRDDFHWTAGIYAVHTDNGNLNIQYGLSGVEYVQVSHYLMKKLVGYLHFEMSQIQIKESLSFNQTSALVNQMYLKIGLRQLMPEKWGYLAGELAFPDTPNYSNKAFLFKTGAVPSIHFSWYKHFQPFWFLKYPVLQTNNSIIFSINKNLYQKEDVFIDDDLDIHLSSSIRAIPTFTLAPFLNSRLQKLLAPLSPWETERKSRWLGIITLGMDITPINHNWDWLHFRVSVPVYRWASEIGFPDGTQPTPKVFITLSFKGTFPK